MKNKFDGEREAPSTRELLGRALQSWRYANKKDSPSSKLCVYKKISQAPSLVQEPSYTLTIKPPKVIWSDSESAKLERAAYNVKVLPAGCAEVKGAFVVEGSNSVQHGFKMHVDEYSNNYPQVSDPRSDPVVVDYNSTFILANRKPDRNSIRNLEDAFWLAGRFGSEFGHFINSFLPRVTWMREHPMWGKIPVVLSETLPNTHIDFFKLLAPNIEIVLAKPQEHFYVKKLIYTPSRVFSPYNIRQIIRRPQHNVFVEPVEFGRLRQSLLDACSDKPNPFFGKSYFLTRFGYDRRKLVNKDIVYSALEAAGLIPIDLANLSALDQTLFWSGARKVVGELSSWVYLSALGSSIQIFGLNSDRDSQWWADISGVENVSKNSFSLVLGQTLEEYRGDTSESGPHRPWRLSTDGLECLLQSIDNIP